METLFAIAAVAFGAAFIIIGWRGRRIDEHPLCRACGFDLVGRAPDSICCAECGTDLTDRRAILIGHRRRYGGVLAAGCALAVPALLVLGVMTFVSVRGIDLAPYKPAWLLARDVTSGNGSAGKSLAELTRRVSAGTVLDSHITAIAATCLAKQGNVKLTWDPWWGRFIEAARAAGKLPDDKWALYARQAFVLTLQTHGPSAERPLMPNTIRLRERSSTTAVIQLAQPRLAGASFVGLLDWAALWIDDEQPQPLARFHLSAPKPFHARLDARPGGWGASQSTPMIPTTAGKQLAAGEHTLHGVARLHIFDPKDVPSQVGGPGTRATPDVAKQVTEAAVDLSCPFEAFEPAEEERDERSERLL